MSHFSRMRTVIKDRECLLQALEECGLKPLVAKEGTTVPVHNRYSTGETHQAHICIPSEQIETRYTDIGFQWIDENEGFAIVTDWWDLNRTPKAAELMSQSGRSLGGTIMLRYCRALGIKNAKAQGFEVVGEEIKDGQLVLTTQRVKPVNKVLERAKTTATATTRIRTRG